MRLRTALAVPAVLALVLGACGDDDDEGGGDGGASTDAELVAPAALEGIATTLVEESGAELSVSTENEQAALVEMVSGENRPPVTLIPNAWLQGVEDVEATPFGRNLAVIVTPAGNPEGIEDLTAFAADSGLNVAACGDATQFGNLAALTLANAGVEAADDVASSEENCEQDVLEQVAAGDLDAALVFRSGLEIPDGTEVVEVPEESNTVIEVSYVLGEGEDAATFGEFVESDEGQQLLEENGYLP